MTRAYLVVRTSALLRVSHLPLVRSAVQSVTSMYLEVKSRFPLLDLMGGVAEFGVRSVSQEAMRRATPLLQSLEPQIEFANSFALVGLDRLEENFPILNQSTDEVMNHLKDAFFLTLDDVQMWVVDGLDGALDQLERLTDGARTAMGQLQETPLGQAAMSGMDNMLSRLEDATAYYLPLPPTLRLEWESRVQEYESEDDGDEPSFWTRIRILLLSLGLQLHHRLTKVRDQLQRAVGMLGDVADKVGLLKAVEGAGDLLNFLQSFLVALLYRAEGLRAASLSALRVRAAALARLTPIRQIRGAPAQVQHLFGEMTELSRLILQMVINVTPLYNVLQKPSPREVEDFLNQEDLTSDGSRHSSANSLFLKAMDGRPRRRRSLFSRTSAGPQIPDPPNGRRNSLKASPAAETESPAPTSKAAATANRRPSAVDLLLTPIKQFVSQSQKAFEYLNPNAPDNPAVTMETVDS
ncbi:perilipin 6 [Pholidichthys leucotaenia]